LCRLTETVGKLLVSSLYVISSNKEQLKCLKVTNVTAQAGTTKVVVKVMGRNGMAEDI